MKGLQHLVSKFLCNVKITGRRLQKLSITFGLKEAPVEQLALDAHSKGKIHPRTGYEGPEGE